MERPTNEDSAAIKASGLHHMQRMCCMFDIGMYETFFSFPSSATLSTSPTHIAALAGRNLCGTRAHRRVARESIAICWDLECAT